MLADRLNHAIRLPKRWPRRVRSAVIHTISLARFALTVARGGAAEALDARVRLNRSWLCGGLRSQQGAWLGVVRSSDPDAPRDRIRHFAMRLLRTDREFESQCVAISGSATAT